MAPVEKKESKTINTMLKEFQEDMEKCLHQLESDRPTPSTVNRNLADLERRFFALARLVGEVKNQPKYAAGVAKWELKYPQAIDTFNSLRSLAVKQRIAVKVGEMTKEKLEQQWLVVEAVEAAAKELGKEPGGGSVSLPSQQSGAGGPSGAASSSGLNTRPASSPGGGDKGEETHQGLSKRPGPSSPPAKKPSKPTSNQSVLTTVSVVIKRIHSAEDLVREVRKVNSLTSERYERALEEKMTRAKAEVLLSRVARTNALLADFERLAEEFDCLEEITEELEEIRDYLVRFDKLTSPAVPQLQSVGGKSRSSESSVESSTVLENNALSPIGAEVEAEGSTTLGVVSAESAEASETQRMGGAADGVVREEAGVRMGQEPYPFHQPGPSNPTALKGARKAGVAVGTGLPKCSVSTRPDRYQPGGLGGATSAHAVAASVPLGVVEPGGARPEVEMEELLEQVRRRIADERQRETQEELAYRQQAELAELERQLHQVISARAETARRTEALRADVARRRAVSDPVPARSFPRLLPDEEEEDEHPSPPGEPRGGFGGNSLLRVESRPRNPGRTLGSSGETANITWADRAPGRNQTSHHTSRRAPVVRERANNPRRANSLNASGYSLLNTFMETSQREERYEREQQLGDDFPEHASEEEDEDVFLPSRRRGEPQRAPGVPHYLMKEALNAIPRFSDGTTGYVNWLAAVQLYDSYCAPFISSQLKFGNVKKTLDGKAKRIAEGISVATSRPFETLLEKLQEEYADRKQIIHRQRQQVLQQKNWPSRFEDQRDWLIAMESVATTFRMFEVDITLEVTLYHALISKLSTDLHARWNQDAVEKRLDRDWDGLMQWLRYQSELTRHQEMEVAATNAMRRVQGTTQEQKSRAKKGGSFQLVTGEVPSEEEPSDEEEESSDALEDSEDQQITFATGGHGQQRTTGAKPKNAPKSGVKKTKPIGEKQQTQRSASESTVPKTSKGQWNVDTKRFERNDKSPCPLKCGSTKHSFANCPAFEKLSVDERMVAVMSYNFCTSCLNNHSLGRCNKKKKCPREGCKYNHHILLHGGDFKAAVEKAASNRKLLKEAKEQGKEANIVLVSVHEKNAPRDSGQSRPDVRALRVTRLLARRPGSADATLVSALVDSAANMSIVDEGFARQLALPLKFATRPTFSFHGTKKNRTAVVDLEVSSDGVNWWRLDRLSTTPQFQLPSIILPWQEKLKPYPEFADVLEHLPDQNYGEVKIILGLDKEFVDGKRFTFPEDGTLRMSHDNRYQAYKSGIGWLASGRLEQELPDVQLMIALLTGGVPVSNVEALEREEDLDQLTRELTSHFIRYQALEDLGVINPPGKMSPQEEVELKRMEETVKPCNGRVEVPMLWKQPKRRMPPSEVQARRRLALLWKRLEANEVLKKHYVESVNQDLAKGYVRRLTEEEVDAWKDEMWILPHFPVYHPDKPHKVRRVCDAAAKNFGVSLNSELEQGPNNLTNLLGCLLRFRRGRFAAQADVKEMFNRIFVSPEDQKRLVFLWQDGPAAPIYYYCYTVHIFGARCAPAVANFVVGHILTKEGVKEPTVQQGRFYMDDFFLEADSAEEVVLQAKAVRDALARNGMELGKWVANSSEVLCQLKTEEGVPATKVVLEDKEQTYPATNKALGVQWDLEKDAFSFSTRQPESRPRTAAEVLSMLASVFDPLGLIAPFVFCGKLLMREVWNDKKGWHVPVSDEVIQRWLDWAKQIATMSDFAVPRWYGFDYNQPVDLHIFGDASEKGYGTVAYLAWADKSGKRSTAFVNAKSRLNTEKTPSTAICEQEPIARVELQACLLAFRQAAMLREELNVNLKKIVVWTDSQVTYWWTRNHRERYQQFVRSRLKEIYDMRFKGALADVSTYVKYVPTKENPADLVSRGTSADELKQQYDFWVFGPEFLRKNEEEWPSQPSRQKSDMCIAVPQPVVLIANQWPEAEDCFKLKHLAKRRLGAGAHTAAAVDAELDELIREVQEEAFPKEVNYLRQNYTDQRTWLPKYSQALKGRRIFLDEKGILRLVSRAELAEESLLDYGEKYPIILPGRHAVSDVLIREAHREQRHAGPSTTWGWISRRWFIPRGRKRCVELLRNCRECRYNEPRTNRPAEASLHRSRLNLHKPAWTEVGMDFFGPIPCTVPEPGKKADEPEVIAVDCKTDPKKKFKQVKRYGLVFIDMTTRAVHLELTDSMDVTSVVFALERFRHVRGQPEIIRCDNGASFHAADSLYRRIEEKLLQDVKRIVEARFGMQFEYNPPYAPHWGGSWERVVREVKRSLEKALAPVHTSKKTEECVRTCLSGAMWMLNNRPLCELEDGKVLTPAMLINPASSDGFGLPLDVSRAETMKFLNEANAAFWNAFSTGYLGLLKSAQRNGGDGGVRKFNIGQAVLVKNGQRSKPGEWEVAHVTAVHESSDGAVRSLDLRVKRTGELVWRDVQSVAALEDKALVEPLPIPGEDV